jgi:hypothetical protein
MDKLYFDTLQNGKMKLEIH